MARYWLTELVLSAVGWAYIILCAGGIALAVWLPEQRRWKWAAGLLALAAASVLPIRAYRELAEEHRQAEAFQERVRHAYALFKRHCESAGEKIEQTVAGVEGVVWMKWRPRFSGEARQFELDDAYGHDCAQEGCIANLLHLEGGTKRGQAGPWDAAGYSYVDTTDPGDGQKYRYTAAMGAEEDGPSKSGRPVLRRVPISAYTARYGVTWEDLSTREDRQNWIAGGALKVIDLKTGAVIAQRVGYMMDPGLGNQGGGRSPWAFAQQSACPPFPTLGPTTPDRSMTHRETIEFVAKVLQAAGAGHDR